MLSQQFEPENFVDGLLGVGKAFGGKSANEGAELASRLSDMRKERDSQSKAASKAKEQAPATTEAPRFGGGGGAAGDLTFDPMDNVQPITDFQPGGGNRAGIGVANKSKKKKKKKKK
jgi:hypothetical protein